MVEPQVFCNAPVAWVFVYFEKAGVFRDFVGHGLGGKVVKLEVKGELMMMATGKAADENAGAGRCVEQNICYYYDIASATDIKHIT